MSIDRMLRWFPTTWRSRYEAEVRDLLEASPFTWRERRDLLWACADAWGREGTSWVVAIAKFTTAVALRVGLILTAGWIIVRAAELALPPETMLAWWPVTGSDAWRGSLIFVQLATFVVVARHVIGPYERTGDPTVRPTWTQTIGFVLFYAGLVASDGRTARLPEMIWMGIFATMRYSPWFRFLSGSRRIQTSVLGLQ